MKLNQLLSFTPAFFTGTLGVVLLQVLSLSPAEAAPPRGPGPGSDRDRIPASVSQLDTTSHRLVEAYENDLRRPPHGPPRGSERRFLEATRSLEAASHTLKSDVETRQPARRLQTTLYSVRNALDQTSIASRDVRLSERTRGTLFEARALVKQVEDQKGYLFARANSRDDHDHDHDHDRDRDRDKPRGPGGILKKLFGN